MKIQPGEIRKLRRAVEDGGFVSNQGLSPRAARRRNDNSAKLEKKGLLFFEEEIGAYSVTRKGRQLAAETPRFERQK